MKLELQHGCWCADVRLASWQGFQSRRGPYGSRDGPLPSDGRVAIGFAPEGRGTAPLIPSELALLSWFLEHEPQVSREVMDAIVRWCAPDCDERRARLGDDMDIGARIVDVADLRGHIGLHCVHVHQITDRGPPYVGFEFGCDWEEEHGLGVLMHGTRVVEIGHADTAFLLWIAKADKG